MKEKKLNLKSLQCSGGKTLGEQKKQTDQKGKAVF